MNTDPSRNPPANQQPDAGTPDAGQTAKQAASEPGPLGGGDGAVESPSLRFGLERAEGVGGDNYLPHLSRSYFQNELCGVLNRSENEQLHAILDVLDERRRQNAKWGEQRHEMPVWLAILHEETGELSEAVLHSMFGGPERNNVFKEAVQVAAVALQIVEFLRKRIQAEWRGSARAAGVEPGEGKTLRSNLESPAPSED